MTLIASFTEDSHVGLGDPSMGRLTPRQQEILQLLAKGFYYKEIGAALGISHSTVRAHLHSAYRKLEVKSRARAVIKFHALTRQSFL